jgi:methyl-accepting chemotaxis protein
MSGNKAETGEVRVEDRIALFDPGGRLAGDCAEIWSLIRDEAPAIARAFWARYARSPEIVQPIGEDKLDDLGRTIVPYIENKYGNILGQSWADNVREYVRAASAAKVSLTTLYAGIAAGSSVAHDVLARALARDPERFALLSRSLNQASLLEMDVYAAHFDLLRSRAERESRGQRAASFNSEVVSVVEKSAADSRNLRSQASEASAAARGMLGKTSEVAAAAEQSAVAMREAAQTAGRPVHGDRGSPQRSGVAAARHPRRRPALRSGPRSAGRSSHVEAIESILGLIRDIAGQTTFSPTTPPSRLPAPGDAGAASPWSPGSEVACKPDRAGNRRHHPKISAIQQATRQTVDATDSIQQDGRGSADQRRPIRRRWSLQARP